MQRVSNDPSESFYSIRRAASQTTCQQYSEPGHIVSFSMRVIGMSHSMFMLSVEIALQNSGLILRCGKVDTGAL
jgi:hypothetical protein